MEPAQPSVRGPSGASPENPEHELGPGGGGGSKRDDDGASSPPSVTWPAPRTDQPNADDWTFGIASSAWSTRPVQKARAKINRIERMLRHMSLDAAAGASPSATAAASSSAAPLQAPLPASTALPDAGRRALLDLYESSRPGNERHLTRPFKECVKIVDEAGRKLGQYASAFDLYKQIGPPAAQE